MNHILFAWKNSLHGLRNCWQDELAFRHECFLAIPHFIALVVLPLEFWLRLYLLGLWFVLIAVELLNTAIEAVVDLVSPQYHRLAGKAKDCASAAVFCLIVLLALSWGLVLIFHVTTIF